MDFINKIAKGLAAAQAAVGSDELGQKHNLPLEAGGAVTLQARRKRDTGRRVIRLETPLGDGLARIDLTPADARLVAEALMLMANAAADDARAIDAPTDAQAGAGRGSPD
jgi:hypothetical protein